jgi:hypothetical protein
MSGTQTNSSHPGEGHRSGIDETMENSLQGGPEYAPEQSTAPSGATKATPTTGVETTAGVGAAPARNTSNEVEVLCGPLLNYRRMSGANDSLLWHGSVLIVATPGGPQPELVLKCLGRGGIGTGTDTNGVHGDSSLPMGILNHSTQSRTYNSQKLYEDATKAFWRFSIEIPLQDFEAKWEYSISPVKGGSLTKHFAVPAATQSMRIMFHSCNGFSVGTDVDAWSGPALWNDVLRMHSNQPFHVMVRWAEMRVLCTLVVLRNFWRIKFRLICSFYVVY